MPVRKRGGRWQVRVALGDGRRLERTLPHVHLHDLRHTFASWMVRGDVPLAALRDLLGHSSLAVTSKYTHLARPDLVEATKKLRV